MTTVQKKTGSQGANIGSSSTLALLAMCALAPAATAATTGDADGNISKAIYGTDSRVDEDAMAAQSPWLAVGAATVMLVSRSSLQWHSNGSAVSDKRIITIIIISLDHDVMLFL